MNKRPPSELADGASKKAKTDLPIDKDQIAQLIAEKRREIAAKMAAMSKSSAAAMNSNAAVAAAQQRAQSNVAGLAKSDIQRRMDEVAQRIKNTMQSPNIPASITDPTKKGLKMEVHPLFDKSGAVDVDSIKSMFTKSNFSTTKANQRAAVATTKDAITPAAAAAAAAARVMEKEAIKNKDPNIPDSEPIDTKPKTLELIEPPSDFFDPMKNPYFDPKIAARASMPKQRMAGKAFKFIQKGKFVDQANKIRQAAVLEKLKADIAANVKKSGMAVELDMVSDLCVRREPPPAVEWWDAPLLGPELPYDSFTLASEHAANVLSDLIQHPVPIQPPADLGPPPPKPLMLTKQERKKLRRQRRLEAQKEKRDKIRIGLLPPDQPKVKLSNFTRVLGVEAVQDPTKIEALVRAQMRQRQLKHDKYIAENKLTAEQRRERTRLKLVENTHVLVEAAVFKIKSLKRPQHRFKVDVNAQQLFLSGACLMQPRGDCLVVVEGGNRGIKQYKKLMMRRIDWSEKAEDDEEEEGGRAGGAGEDDDGEPNECILIWEGKIKKRLFNGFKVMECRTEREIKDVLEKASASHYWDASKHYTAESL
ncbi:pre-mRNA processing factor 3-domain-containing protein [Chytriomyces cf. hyalinus JEL632]|nr:pre-mRNA processing factor 3-domain-containing protein [Chytriomyces cf. hyalinus JEL632]